MRFHSDFFEAARSFSSPNLVLIYAPGKKFQTENKNEPSKKLDSNQALITFRSIIIVKKTHGNAPQRSKTKRRLRMAMHVLQKEQPNLFDPSYDVAVLVKGAPQEFSVYKKQLSLLLGQLKGRSLNNKSL